MKIGLCLPYMKTGITRNTILDWCRAIDQGPFDSLSCGERITGYTYEMRTLLSAAAAVTERVRIMPTLYVLPMHNAVWAAKEIATLDVLSGGRVTVTVGVGGREDDYRAVGASFQKRHQRMDEQVAQMRRIWAGEPPFPEADEVGPRPLQTGGPPLLAGAMGPKSMARASRWANGVYSFSMNGEESDTRDMLTMAENAWRDSHRDRGPYRMGGFWCCLADNGRDKLRQYVFDYLKGLDTDTATLIADSMTRHTPEAVIEGLHNLAAAGCEEVFLVPATAELSEVERAARVVEDSGLRG